MLCCAESLFSQNADSIQIPRLREGKARIVEAFLVPSTNTCLLQMAYYSGKTSESYYVVLNIKESEVISTFSFKRWTYLHSSWVESDSLLYLSKGMFKTVEVNLNTGRKIKSKFSFRYDSPEDGNGQAYLFENRDLYCSGGMVLWTDKMIYFDSNTHSVIITN